MTSTLRPSTALWGEQDDQRDQSPDPISMLLHEEGALAQASAGYHAGDPSLHADLPSWETLHSSAEQQSEASSDTHEADLDLHLLNMAPKTELSPADIHTGSTTATALPVGAILENGDHTNTDDPNLQASSSTTTVQTTFASQSHSSESRYSTPSTSLASTTATTTLPIKHSNLKPKSFKPRSTLIGVVITKPPPGKRTVTRKASHAAVFPEHPRPDSDVRYRSPPPIASGSKPSDVQSVNSSENLTSSSTPSIQSTYGPGPLHPPSSPERSLSSPALVVPSSLSEQDSISETRSVEEALVTDKNLSNNEDSEVPLEMTRNIPPGTTLADVLTSAFVQNAHQTQSIVPSPEQRRPRPPPGVGAVPLNVSSSTSSMQTRGQTEQRPSYFRKSKVPTLISDKGKGRVLDDEEYAELLDADVPNVVFGAKVTTTEHVRRSNLKSLLDHARLRRPRVGDNYLDNPAHVPTSFTECMVSRDDMFLDMLERTFGPDSHWGDGPKPKLGLKPSFVSEDSRAVTPNEQDGYETDAEETTTSGLSPRKGRSLDITPNEDGREYKRPRISEDSNSTPIPVAPAEWVVLLQGLVKGKAKMNRDRVVFLSNLLRTIDEVKEDVNFDVALDSKLWQTIRQVSELSIGDIPFDDEHDLRGHARAIASFWDLKWSNEVQSD